MFLPLDLYLLGLSQGPSFVILILILVSLLADLLLSFSHLLYPWSLLRVLSKRHCMFWTNGLRFAPDVPICNNSHLKVSFDSP